jgi:hypothetical protein
LSSPHAWGKDTISADIDEPKNANPLINKELFSGGYDLDAMWRSQEPFAKTHPFLLIGTGILDLLLSLCILNICNQDLKKGDGLAVFNFSPFL